MQASKIKFSQETKAALIARPLSKTAKAKLRRERVKDYIRSQPVGTIIKQTDLAVVAGYDKSQGHGWAFINRMVAKGHIKKDTSEGAHKPSWTIPGDSRTVKPRESTVKFPEAPKEMPTLTDPTLKKLVEDMPKFDMHLTDVEQFNEVSLGWVIQHAKDFAWQHNSDSLREFIRWLGSK